MLWGWRVELLVDPLDGLLDLLVYDPGVVCLVKYGARWTELSIAGQRRYVLVTSFLSHLALKLLLSSLMEASACRCDAHFEH